MYNDANKRQRLKALKNGEGVQYILDAAYEILGNPVLMHDMEYKFLACSKDAVTDDPIWNELVTTGKCCDETIEFFKDEYFIDAVANARSITFLASDKLKYDRIFGKVFNGERIVVANLIVLACENPLEDDASTLCEIVCELVSREIKGNEYYKNYGQAYQENIIIKLIEEQIKDRGLYSGHVANLDDGFKTNLYIAATDLSQCVIGADGVKRVKDELGKTHAGFKYAIYDDSLIFIMSSDNPAPSIKKILSRFNKIFEEHNMHVGISGSFENLYELRRYYNQAVNALSEGLKSNSAQRIFLYKPQ